MISTVPFSKCVEAHPDRVPHLPDTYRLQHTRVPELCENHVRLELHGRLVIVGFNAPDKPWVTPEKESSKVKLQIWPDKMYMSQERENCSSLTLAMPTFITNWYNWFSKAQLRSITKIMWTIKIPFDDCNLPGHGIDQIDKWLVETRCHRWCFWFQRDVQSCYFTHSSR